MSGGLEEEVFVAGSSHPLAVLDLTLELVGPKLYRRVEELEVCRACFARRHQLRGLCYISTEVDTIKYLCGAHDVAAAVKCVQCVQLGATAACLHVAAPPSVRTRFASVVEGVVLEDWELVCQVTHAVPGWRVEHQCTASPLLVVAVISRLT
jgi:hypothetical protein